MIQVDRPDAVVLAIQIAVDRVRGTAAHSDATFLIHSTDDSRDAGDSVSAGGGDSSEGPSDSASASFPSRTSLSGVNAYSPE